MASTCFHTYQATAAGNYFFGEAGKRNIYIFSSSKANGLWKIYLLKLQPLFFSNMRIILRPKNHNCVLCSCIQVGCYYLSSYIVNESAFSRGVGYPLIKLIWVLQCLSSRWFFCSNLLTWYLVCWNEKFCQLIRRSQSTLFVIDIPI